MSTRSVVVALCAAAAVPITAPGQSFALIGAPSGATDSSVWALSQNGSVAAGFSTFPPNVQKGLTWSASGGRSDFGLAPGMPIRSAGFGISSDGSVIVGNYYDTTFRAFRWTGTGPLQDIGPVPGYTRGQANGVSGDGSIVVGYSERGPNTQFDGQAFRWTAGGSIQGLGFARPTDSFSTASAISRDGGTIVGSSQTPFVSAVAFTWSQPQGMRVLPGLPGSSSSSDSAFAVSADGLIAVGTAHSPTNRTHPVMWTGGVITDLGIPAGFLDGYANGTSDDGSVIGGTIFAQTSQAASVWTPATGTIPLADYLAANGVQVPTGWSLRACYTVSADGHTFGGFAAAPGGTTGSGFVATIPAPGSTLLAALVPAALYTRWRGQRWKR